MAVEVERKLKAYVEEKHVSDRDVGLDEALLDSGVIDSAGIFELVEFIESAFGVEISDEEIVPEHFDTLRAIATFVESKRQS